MRISGAVRRLVFVVLAACLTNSARAAVIVGLRINPVTTSGVATSNRSGVGAWQLYAIDDAQASDFGISSYSVTMVGATAINHRSPNGTAVDNTGTLQDWGYRILRSGTNSNPIVAAAAASPPFNNSPFRITGFGRTAGDATSQITAIDPGATGITATSGASWGTYDSIVLNSPNAFLSPGSTAAAAAVAAGRKWVFLAEGLGYPSISVSSFTVYSNVSGASVPASSSTLSWVEISPEPSSAVLLLAGLMLAGFSARSVARRSG